MFLKAAKVVLPILLIAFEVAELEAITITPLEGGGTTLLAMAKIIADEANGVTVVGSPVSTVNTGPVGASTGPASDERALGVFTGGMTDPGEELLTNNIPNQPAATYTGGLEINDGVVLTTGLVSDSLDPICADRGVGVEGPNNGRIFTGPSSIWNLGNILTVLGTPKDTDFSLLAINSLNGKDATVLQFDIELTEPGILTSSFVFGSDEFPDHSGDFNNPNDSFAIIIEGENIATVIDADEIETAFDLFEVSQCLLLFLKNDTPPYDACGLESEGPFDLTNSLHGIENAAGPYYDIEFGGFTKEMTRERCKVLRAGTYTVKLVIQDVGDDWIDSGVFFKQNGLKVMSLTPGDFDMDGKVSNADLTFLLDHWGGDATCYEEGDINGDGMIGNFELTALLDHWGDTGNGNFCADFNRDGRVDTADLGIYDTFKDVLTSCASRFEGDANRDGKVNAADKTIYDAEVASGKPSPPGTCCDATMQMAMGGGGGAFSGSSEIENSFTSESERSGDQPEYGSFSQQTATDVLDRDQDGDVDRDDVLLWSQFLNSEE